MDKLRCTWCSSELLYQTYHDKEWGIPIYEDQKLFELLTLEGFQSGLSWITILRKRDAFRETFENFDCQSLAHWSDEKIAQALLNPTIIRNRLKIESVRTNAQAFIRIQEKFGNFKRFIWEFVDYKPIQNHFESLQDLPSSTEISIEMSKSLKKNGFRFVGPTICYAFMQATGMVNDHLTFCHRYTNKINEHADRHYSDLQ